LAGHPSYTVKAESVQFNKKNLLQLKPEQRAHAGLFLAFQYPLTVSGISLSLLIPEMIRARGGKKTKSSMQHLTLASALAREQQEQTARVKQQTEKILKQLALPEEMLHRSLNEQFSGGEKKKTEIVQLFAAQPKLAILDEPDSGLDVDALKKIA